MIGSQISHYRLLDKLGGGSMGVVYRAEDTRSGNEVAFKFLPFDLRDDQTARDAFVDEAQASSAIEHPNICTIQEIGNSDDGRMFVAMTLYEGETLKKRLETGALPVDEALRIVRQIADGMAAAHERGIVHRDLKPGNIMLTASGDVKIVDFGLARVVSQGQPGLTQIGASMGTPTYMSPEQTLGDPVDARSDVWSLGVVFYECLTGRLPFDGPNLPSVIQAIHSKQPEPPSRINPDVTPAIEELVLACLAKTCDERLASCRELVDGLDAIDAGTAGRPSADSPKAHTMAAEDSDSSDSGAAPDESTDGTPGKGGCLLIFAAPLLGLLAALIL